MFHCGVLGLRALDLGFRALVYVRISHDPSPLVLRDSRLVDPVVLAVRRRKVKPRKTGGHAREHNGV